MRMNTVQAVIILILFSPVLHWLARGCNDQYHFTSHVNDGHIVPVTCTENAINSQEHPYVFNGAYWILIHGKILCIDMKFSLTINYTLQLSCLHACAHLSIQVHCSCCSEVYYLVYFHCTIQKKLKVNCVMYVLGFDIKFYVHSHINIRRCMVFLVSMDQFAIYGCSKYDEFMNTPFENAYSCSLRKFARLSVTNVACVCVSFQCVW
jgi:hypothetical protein